MKRKLFGSRKRVVISSVVGVFLMAGTAFAAWTIFFGTAGSGSGTFGSATEGGTAITITGTSNPVLLPGESVNMDVTLQNNDPDKMHQVTLVAGDGTFTSSPSECAAYLSLTPGTLPPVPAGQTVSALIEVNAAPDIPVSCAEGTWSVDFSGAATS